MPVDRIAKLVFDMKVDGRRSRGCPGTWEEGIWEALVARNLDWRRRRLLAQDQAERIKLYRRNRHTTLGSRQGAD